MGLNDTTLFWISAHDPYEGDYINYRWYLNGRYEWGRDTIKFISHSWYLKCDIMWLGYNELKAEVNDGFLGTTLEHIWIVAIDTNIVGISGEDISTQPNEFMLYQNYPNPFNASTSIEFMLPYGRYTALKIYNILGKEVVTLLDKELREGSHRAVWNGKDKKGKEVSSGIYFYVLRAGNDIKVMKMVLIR
jgi:hypothetical protein